MKISKNVPFTMVANEVFKRKLSLKAIGLFSYIMNKPDGWDFSIEGTATQVKDGIDSVRTALHELEENGFIECKRERKSDGKLGDGVWMVDNSPSEKPTLENPTLEKPMLVKPVQVYKKEVNTNKVNNNITTYVESFNQLFEKQYQETDSRKKKLEARLKKYTLEEILTALRTLSQSPWHRGVNDRGWAADPDFLIRSDEQVDKWLNTNMEQVRQLSQAVKTGEAYGKSIIGYITTQ